MAGTFIDEMIAGVEVNTRIGNDVDCERTGRPVVKLDEEAIPLIVANDVASSVLDSGGGLVDINADSEDIVACPLLLLAVIATEYVMDGRVLPPILVSCTSAPVASVVYPVGSTVTVTVGHVCDDLCQHE